MSGYLYILKIDSDLVKVGMTLRSFNRRYSEYPLVNILGVAQVDNAESSEKILRSHFAEQYTRVKETEYFKCDPYKAAFEFQKVIGDLSKETSTLYVKLQQCELHPIYLHEKDTIMPYCEIISVVLKGYKFRKEKIVLHNGSLWVPGNNIDLRNKVPVSQEKIIDMVVTMKKKETHSGDNKLLPLPLKCENSNVSIPGTVVDINDVNNIVEPVNTTVNVDYHTAINKTSRKNRRTIEAVLLDMSF